MVVVCAGVAGKGQMGGGRLEEIEIGYDEKTRKKKKVIKNALLCCMRSGIDWFENRANGVHSSQKIK